MVKDKNFVKDALHEGFNERKQQRKLLCLLKSRFISNPCTGTIESLLTQLVFVESVENTTIHYILTKIFEVDTTFIL